MMYQYIWSLVRTNKNPTPNSHEMKNELTCESLSGHPRYNPQERVRV